MRGCELCAVGRTVADVRGILPALPVGETVGSDEDVCALLPSCDVLSSVELTEAALLALDASSVALDIALDIACMLLVTVAAVALKPGTVLLSGAVEDCTVVAGRLVMNSLDMCGGGMCVLLRVTLALALALGLLAVPVQCKGEREKA